MAKGNDLDERLVIGTPTGANSAVFKVWSPVGKSDVYASIREHAGVFKISLHDGGKCFAGLTKSFADSEPDAIAEMGGSRHQNRWTRQTHVGSLIVTPLQFVVPASELRSWREKEVATDGVRWLPAPSVGRSVIISCIFGGQKLPDEEWPGRRNGTELVSTKLLPNGEKFWLIWQDCATSDHEFEMLRQRLEVQQQRKMVRFADAPSNAALEPRTLIFKEFRLDRLLVVMDSATETATDAP